MKNLVSGIFIVFSLISCQKEKNMTEVSKTVVDENQKIKISPLDELKQVNELLDKVKEPPQTFTVSSNKNSLVKGKKGTIIHVNPAVLETEDGTSIGMTIEVELLELTEKSDFVLQNAQTLSNGRILVSGGAYYINMISDGKKLRIKKGRGIDVEFPKLSEDEMSLFLGERDSLNQINWVKTNKNFKNRKFLDLKEPTKSPKKETPVIYTEDDESMDSLFNKPKLVNKSEVSEKQYKEYLQRQAEYEERLEQRKFLQSTYENVSLTNFGWINCDRFYEDNSPKVNIELIVKNDSLSGVVSYAVFRDIKSILNAQYWKGMKTNLTFKEIPKNKEITIITLSKKGNTLYMDKTNVKAEANKQITVDFEIVNEEKIKEAINNLK